MIGGAPLDEGEGQVEVGHEEQLLVEVVNCLEDLEVADVVVHGDEDAADVFIQIPNDLLSDLGIPDFWHLGSLEIFLVRLKKSEVTFFLYSLQHQNA